MKSAGNLPFANGNIVKGTIIEVRPKEVLVDIATRAKASSPPRSLTTSKRSRSATRSTSLLRSSRTKRACCPLQGKSGIQAELERILTICNEGGTISGRVKAIVKGGLLVNIAWKLFCLHRKSTSSRQESPAYVAIPTTSKSSRSTRSGRTSFCPARTHRAGTPRTPPEASYRNGPGDIRKGT